MTRWIFHVDMDEFIAAVEVLRHPELRGKPVIVGGDGDPTKRGVVSTASYEAREFGVRSAMPLRTALKRCPDGVFLAVDADHYLEASSRVMDTLRTFPAVVQVLGWDEAFMAVETDDPEALARDVQREVLERTDLWCSIGVGDSKHRAKLGSAFAKPRGVFRLTRQEWPTLMGPRPVEALWGIGKKTAAKLNELGIHTVDELASADDDLLATRFGPNTGPWIRSLGTGEDDGEVTAEPYVRRGQSHEHTFQQDLTDLEEIRAQAERIARELFDDLPEDRQVMRVTVKLRTSSFFTSTHQRKLAEPTRDVDRIVEGVLEALAMFELDRPVRLLGRSRRVHRALDHVGAAVPEGVDATPHPASHAELQRLGQAHRSGHEHQEPVGLDATPIEGIGRRLGGGLQQRHPAERATESSGPYEQQPTAFPHVRAHLGGGLDPHTSIFGTDLSPQTRDGPNATELPPEG